MDIGSAFTYVFDDEDWLKKLGIGGGIALVGFILSFILIGVLLFLPIFGYMLQTLKNVRDNFIPEDPEANKRVIFLPEWDNIGGLFKDGLMVVVIMLIYNIPTLFIYCSALAVGMGVGQLNDPDVAEAMVAVVFCLVCVSLIVAFFCNFLVPAALIYYAQDDSLGSAFQFGKMMSFIKNNIGDYIIVILLVVVAGFISQFGGLLCFVGLFFTHFWSRLVVANLYGQLARKA